MGESQDLERRRCVSEKDEKRKKRQDKFPELLLSKITAQLSKRIRSCLSLYPVISIQPLTYFIAARHTRLRSRRILLRLHRMSVTKGKSEKNEKMKEC